MDPVTYYYNRRKEVLREIEEKHKELSSIEASLRHELEKLNHPTPERPPSPIYHCLCGEVYPEGRYIEFIQHCSQGESREHRLLLSHEKRQILEQIADRKEAQKARREMAEMMDLSDLEEGI